MPWRHVDAGAIWVTWFGSEYSNATDFIGAAGGVQVSFCRASNCMLTQIIRTQPADFQTARTSC
jgi:hypothetical protein